MNAKDCIRANCEYLSKQILTGKIICADTGSPIENICNCSIVDELYAKKGEMANAS